jgi:hypothetical protein
MPFGKAEAKDQFYSYFINKDTEGYWKFLKNSKINSIITDDFISLMNGIFEPDPALRFSIDDIRAHPWYNGLTSTH